MTSRLELNWKLGGFVDEQHYYCETSPIDVNNLPSPKSVLAGNTRTYTDTAITVGQTYYVRISSIKNGIKKVSDELEISTELNDTYQHLRIYITSDNGGEGLTGIQEVEIASIGGGADITSPGMLVASSTSYVGYGPDKLIDNNFTDVSGGCWISEDGAPFPHWVSINFGSQQNLAEIRIWPQAVVGGLPRSPKDFKIQGSNDGIVWTDIQAFTGITGWSVGVQKTFNLMTGAYF